MSLTVIYPDGSYRRYNRANHISRETTGWVLRTTEAGDWVASIQMSAGVIVEANPPCSASMARERQTDSTLAINRITKALRELRCELRAKAKSKKGGAR